MRRRVREGMELEEKGQECRRTDTPKMPALTKCSRLKYSSKSFWIGVPDRRILF